MNPSEISNSKTARIVSWLAGVVIGLVVIVLPLGYFFISYQHLAGELESETVLIANSVTQEVISSNPEVWQYGQTRMEEFLNYRLRQPDTETRRIFNSSNEVIAATVGTQATPPLVMRSFPLFDSGVPVGKLEIVRSLRPTLRKSALFVLVTLPFGAAAYLIMRTLPLRAIRRMEDALLKANAELERKVHDRTAALDEANKELQAEIAARELKETELRESQQYLSAIIQFYPDATMVIDDKGHIVAWNLAVEKLTGVGAEKMLGKGDYEYAIPFYGERRPLLINLALQPDQEVEVKYDHIERRGNMLVGESYIQNASGQKIYFHGTAAPLRNSQGQIIGAIESIRDISEKKLAELALQSKFDLEKIISTISTGFNRLPAERIGDGIDDSLRIVGEFAGADRSYLFQINDDGKTADNTHEWCAEGITPQRQNLQGIVPERDFPWLANEISKLDTIKLECVADLPPEAANEIMEFEKEGIKSLLIAPLVLDNKLIGFMGLDSVRAGKSWARDNESLLSIVGEILVNALSRQRGGQEIHKLTAELERKVAKRTSQLVAAQEELMRKEKLAILGQLSGSVGHELRNPLGVMSNAVYFLKMVHADSDEKTKEYLEIIKHEIDNSQRIITDLLDFARTKTPQTRAISVEELLSRSIGNCIIPATVDLQIDVPDSLPLLKIDPLQLEQVFQNLITNAVQAMPKGGTLRIVATPETNSLNSNFSGEFIGISLTDTGEGILPENKHKLFQPLFTTKAKGIGLGLVVCRNLIEANGGRIEVESLPGEGTTFTVIMPAMEGCT